MTMSTLDIIALFTTTILSCFLCLIVDYCNEYEIANIKAINQFINKQWFSTTGSINKLTMIQCSSNI